MSSVCVGAGDDREPEIAEAAQRPSVCEHTFVPELRYTLIEHDPSRPWVVIGEARHLVVELASADQFSAWASVQWPRDRYTVQLDPGQEQRHLRY